MPIANCLISSQLQSDSDSLIDRWAEQSGVAADLLTINIEIELVHVVTQWVESGDVVENGEQVSW